MKITIAGGDLRMLTAGSLLAEAGYDCYGFGFGEQIKRFPKITPAELSNATEDSAAIILPLPCQKDGFLNAPFSESRIETEMIFSSGKENTLFIGGRLPKTGENYIDYSQREDFQIKNAVPTAEGALALAMKELNTTVFGAKAVIAGYGRIGKYLGSLLKSLGAEVTVLARSPQSRAFAETNGLKAVGFDECEAPLSGAQVLFNTVPSMVITETEIRTLPEESIIIDLASLPGGVDESAAQNYGTKFLRALSLPGKVAPISAGKIVFETVYTILQEKGVVI